MPFFYAVTPHKAQLAGDIRRLVTGSPGAATIQAWWRVVEGPSGRHNSSTMDGAFTGSAGAGGGPRAPQPCADVRDLRAAFQALHAHAHAASGNLAHNIVQALLQAPGAPA